MSVIFYQAVVQAVLIFGADTWVLLAVISRNLEGVHMGFLRQIMGQKANRQREKTWRSEAEEKVLKEARTHFLGEYIDKQEAKMAEWVLLRPILEVYNNETGYEGRGEAPGTVVATNNGPKAPECNIKRYFGGAKGRGGREVAE